MNSLSYVSAEIEKLSSWIRASPSVRDCPILKHQQLLNAMIRYCSCSILFEKNISTKSYSNESATAHRLLAEYFVDNSGRFSLPSVARYIHARTSANALTYGTVSRLLDAAILVSLTHIGEQVSPGAHCALCTSPSVLNALHDLVCISSLLKTDWIKQVLAYEPALESDPAGMYNLQEVESKRIYRNAVAAIAKKVACTEVVVASAAVDLATAHPYDSVSGHVGYYLVDDGVQELTSVLSGSSRKNSVAGTLMARIAIYFMCLCLPAFILFCYMALAVPYEFTNVAICALVAGIVIISMDGFRGPVEMLLGGLRKERHCLRIDYETKGLPNHCRVLIAVPVHLVSEAHFDRVVDTAIWNLIQANDSNVSVVLLTDFPDSNLGYCLPGERNLLEYAIRKVESTRTTSIGGYGRELYLLHRDREFSEVQSKWIGKERKRGKLVLLNSLVADRKNGFSREVIGSAEACMGTSYILCLDEDSRLTRHTLVRMAGFLAHPLNTPRIHSGRITGGHALATPWSVADSESVSKWRWPGITTGPSRSARLAPSPSRSFMYDWLGRSAYSGKGMYDPKVYAYLCEGKIPDDLILSHDTIEAELLRAGHVSGAIVTDGYPSTLRSLMDRQERWIRGDIQNVYFVVKRYLRQDLSFAEQNSLFTSLTVLNQAVAWTSNALVFVSVSMLMLLNYPPALCWAMYVALMAGGYQRLITSFAIDRHNLSSRSLSSVYCRFIVRIHLAQIARIAMSPISFVVLVRAVLTTLYRILSNKRLLEWRATALTENTEEASLDFHVMSWIISLVSAISVLSLYLSRNLSSISLCVLFMWSLTAFFEHIFIRQNK